MRELFVAGVLSWWIGDAVMVLTPFAGSGPVIERPALACFAPKDETRHVNTGIYPVVRVRTISYPAPMPRERPGSIRR